MQVTAIRVGFSRRISPAQYESMGAEVDLNILVDPSETTESLIEQAGALARAKVYEMLGLKAPALTIVAPVALQASTLPAPVQAAATISDATTEPAKRTRRTKAEMEAARLAEATPATKTNSELFADESTDTALVKQPLVSTITDEDPLGLGIPQTAPASPASPTIVEEEWEKPTTISDGDLAAACSKHATRTAGKAAVLVKDWKLKHGIPRIVELKQELRPQLIKELEAL